eukprot:2750529-Rhodomonas_salina.1
MNQASILPVGMRAGLPDIDTSSSDAVIEATSSETHPNSADSRVPARFTCLHSPDSPARVPGADAPDSVLHCSPDDDHPGANLDASSADATHM